MIYKALRPLLFGLQPENAHHYSLRGVQMLGGVPGLGWTASKMLQVPPKPVEVFGLTFANPLGLAAGYDKDGLGLRGLAHLGFGHVEVGTVTPQPQAGNPLPRLFRLKADQAIINRFGFPSRGADFLAQRLSLPRPKGVIVGVNIGKNKETPNAEATADYLMLLERFAPLADYLVVNVSSPNTQGLRRLQARDTLQALLGALTARRDQRSPGRPVLVKLSPDLDDAALEDAVGAAVDAGIDGIVATNTTVSRAGVRGPHIHQPGGLSGPVLEARSTTAVAKISELTAGNLPIIGVGGVSSVDDVRRKLDAGASLVQVYTALVYQGPGVVRRWVRAL